MTPFVEGMDVLPLNLVAFFSAIPKALNIASII
jgi:hypothetical protein